MSIAIQPLSSFATLTDAKAYFYTAGVILTSNEMGSLFAKFPGTLTALEAAASQKECRYEAYPRLEIQLEIQRYAGADYIVAHRCGNDWYVLPGRLLTTWLVLGCIAYRKNWRWVFAPAPSASTQSINVGVTSMAIIVTSRAQKVASAFTQADTTWSRLVSEMTAAVGKTMEYTAWFHQNQLSGGGDVDEDDRVAFRTSFAARKAELDALMEKLQACYDIYDADDATRQANLDAFVSANGIDLATTEARFN